MKMSAFLFVLVACWICRGEQVILEVEASEDGVSWYETGRAFQISTSEPKSFYRLKVVRPFLTISTHPSAPGLGVVSAGSADVLMTVAKFRATGEDFRIFRIGLKLRSGEPQNIRQVTVWDGPVQVGTAVFVGENHHAVAVFEQPIFVPKDVDKILTLRVDLEKICATCSTDKSGELVAVDINTTSEPVGFETSAVGVATGQSAKINGSAGSAGIRVYKSFPSFQLDPLSMNGLIDGRLLRFKVTADQAGDISIGKFSFGWASFGAVVTKVNLFAYTDQNYSSPVSGVGQGGKVQSQDLCVTECEPSNLIMGLYPESPNGERTSIVVPAGATYYFELRGFVVATSSDAQVTTILSGDDTSVARGDLGYVDSLSMFAWSPNSAGLFSALGAEDWFNGVGLPGFPMNPGLVQSRVR